MVVQEISHTSKSPYRFSGPSNFLQNAVPKPLPGVKAVGYKDDKLPPYTTKVKNHSIYAFILPHTFAHGPDSVVGNATAYGLDGLGIESRWWRDFPHLSRPALRSTQPPVQWVPGLSRG
jgi:hypothetical protein